jgi:hypothetical protein
MLTIYTGRDFFPRDLPPAVPMLLPWRPEEDRPAIVPGIYHEYVRVASTIFSEAPLPNATVGVLPFSWKYTLHHPQLRRLATEFARTLADAGKRLVIFFDSDSVDAVDIANAIVFRTSGYRSKARSTELGMPGWGQCVERPLSAREKRAPVVGFCGYAPPLGIPLSATKVKEAIRWALVRARVNSLVEVHPGYFARVEAIRSCRRTVGLTTNFLLRPAASFVVDEDKWGTGRLRNDGGGSFQSTFLSNMSDSDYILCTRGFGNYSFRLYEALSCGRIPVFVDTDCLLPFPDNPLWRSATLWVDHADVGSAGERIVEHHRRISPDTFIDRQHEARRFWDEWLSPLGFFRRFAATVATVLSGDSRQRNDLGQHASEV